MMICNVLIVDDEVTTRRGLTKLIEKNATNWNVVGAFRNGHEAIKQTKVLKPELVLTDIRMPNMSGIDLAKAIHHEHPRTKVVMLTGYKNLEYAQAGIRYGVVDFLLKPCSEKELLKVLDKTYNTIIKEMKHQENLLLERRLIEENTIRSLMLRLPYDQARVERIKKYYLQKELLLCKVVTYFPKSKAYRHKDLSLLQLSISQITEELIGKFDLRGIMLPILHDMYAIFLDPSSSISNFNQTLEKVIYEVTGITIEIHHTNPIEDLLQLPDCLENNIRIDTNNLLKRANLKREPISNSNLEVLALNQNKIEAVQGEILSKIMVGQVDQVKCYVDSYIKNIKNLSIEKAKLEVLILVLSFYEIIQKEFVMKDLEVGVGIQINQLQPLNEMDEVVGWVMEQGELFYNELNTWLKTKNENLVAKSISYIEDHYMENCSLKEVADYVHLSPNYFSNLFKLEKGESFVNYITNLRINKSKILLSNTNMKIFEIAESVGYDDSNYFTTVFKRLTKKTPREYRTQAEKHNQGKENIVQTSTTTFKSN
ncbi:response regulator transcription factor [Gracilibacillus timonensis]|uniref:response regulator transcription factor n=1 Tax=Gracilibacillus timonensis TaxID=1816696 RepID=UPI0008261CC1|nr:response regulator [Gracilibacillus timonensis]